MGDLEAVEGGAEVEDLEAVKAQVAIGLERMLRGDVRDDAVVIRGPMLPLSRQILADVEGYSFAFHAPADRIDWPAPFPWVEKLEQWAGEADRRVRAAWRVLRHGLDEEVESWEW